MGDQEAHEHRQEKQEMLSIYQVVEDRRFLVTDIYDYSIYNSIIFWSTTGPVVYVE